MSGPPAPPPPPPPPDVPPPPHAHIPVAKGGASLSELLSKRVKKGNEGEDANEPVWSLASSHYLQPRSSTGFVGLSNQGATCYLNSLIQTLFMTPELRRVLYQWQYDPLLDGTEESCIPLQLQRLFIRLQLGSAAIVETKDLTTSFGWLGNQAFEQHDVQELLRKLFEALEVCFTRGATAIRSNPVAASMTEQVLTANESSKTTYIGGINTAKSVNELYEGSMTDYIRCMECSGSRERRDAFFDISLTIRDVDSIEDALNQFLAPEVLSESNQWFCDSCATKVDAFKGMQLYKLPYFLTLQLKRFDYDYVTWRRIKLNNKVSFPVQLNMNPFFVDESPDGPRDWNYELMSVMIHAGGAEGGHYFAFVKDFATGKWFKFNDSSVTEIAEADIAAVFGGAAPLNQTIQKDAKEQDTKNQETNLTDNPAAPKPPPHPFSSNYSTNAYMVIYRLVDPTKNELPPSADLLSAEQMGWIQSENEAFDKLRAEHQKRLDNIALTVFYDNHLKKVSPENPAAQEQNKGTTAPSKTDNMSTLTVNVDKHETLESALQLTYSTAISRELAVPSLGQMRLRPFCPQTGTKAPSWLASEYSLTLEQLAFSHQKNVYLEVRQDAETDWIDEEVFYTLGITQYFHPTQSLLPPVSIRVPWRSTLGDLQQIVRNTPELTWKKEYSLEKLYNLESTSPASSEAAETKCLLFVVDTSANCRILSGEEKIVNQSLQVSDGQVLHMEYVPASIPAQNSMMYKHFEEERHKVQIFYNDLNSTHFDNFVLIDNRKTLRNLKDEIAKNLGKNMHQFKMCRNLLSKEFNNLDLSIGAANLFEGSAVCIVSGRPIGANQLKLKISVLKPLVGDVETFSESWNVLVDQDATVDELRSLVLSSVQLDSFIKNGTIPQPPPDSEDGIIDPPDDFEPVQAFIRLREKKSNRCGSVLFDGIVLKEAMDNLADGDEVIVQILQQEDTLQRNQMLLLVRRWIPKDRALEPASTEIIITRHSTLAAVRKHLAEHVKTLSEPLDIPIEFLWIAKPYYFMITKKDSSAISGLNWQVADDALITQSPWYLSDGDLILYKDARDPEIGHAEASSAGSDSSGKTRTKERQLQIHTVFDMPPPSDDKDDALKN